MKYLFFDGINRVLIPVDGRLSIGMVGKERHLFIGDALFVTSPATKTPKSSLQRSPTTSTTTTFSRSPYTK